MSNLADKCVNIEELHLVNPFRPYPENDYLSQIRFHHLKMLSFRRICMPFGSPDLVKVSILKRNREITFMHSFKVYNINNQILNFNTSSRSLNSAPN